MRNSTVIDWDAFKVAVFAFVWRVTSTIIYYAQARPVIEPRHLHHSFTLLPRTSPHGLSKTPKLLLGVKLIDRLAECENRCYTTDPASVCPQLVKPSNAIHSRDAVRWSLRDHLSVQKNTQQQPLQSSAAAASSSSVSWSVKLFRLASYQPGQTRCRKIDLSFVEESWKLEGGVFCWWRDGWDKTVVGNWTKGIWSRFLKCQ